MPATQHDAVLWIAGSAYDVVFDVARAAIAALAGVASVADETSSWPYRHDLDLTGFIDGTENPTLLEAPGRRARPRRPARRGRHGPAPAELGARRAGVGGAVRSTEQERVIGRTKADSIELDDKPEDSHVARTDQDEFGKIFRRNMPYGTVTDHGTMFVGFCAEQGPLAAMLESMAGLGGAARRADALHDPLTGAYYFVPSGDALARAGGPPPA